MQSIGREVQVRMESLGLDAEELADKSFLELKDVQSIINGEKNVNEIDEFELSLICSVLHCKPEYFFDPSIREKDLLLSSMNRGNDDIKSKDAKIRIQDFINDFTFVSEVLAECD